MSPDSTPAHHHFVQAPVRPLDEDGVQVSRLGTLAWLVACGVMWLHREELRSTGRGWWLWTGLAGVLVGLAALAWCTRRRAGRR